MIIIHIRRKIKHFLNFFRKKYFRSINGQIPLFFNAFRISMRGGREQTESIPGESGGFFGKFFSPEGHGRDFQGIFACFCPFRRQFGWKREKPFLPIPGIFRAGFPSPAVRLTAGTPRPGQSERISRAARPPFDSRISPQLLIFFAFRKN